ncbi:MAG TPA: cyclic nucleotide-binding domain-containing protein [Roseiarcus sp.]|nr:cyclic nucleotide-binding domain-containing protein [Roseiarcus sp.]
MRINWIELSGYVASALVFLAFYMKTMIPLRVVGILSNIAFMTYGFGGRLYPVLVLHAILLPLNCVRLLQMRGLIRKVRAASRGDLSMEWLVPMMRRRRCAKGEVLFRRGDPAKELYLLFSGSVRLLDLGVELGPGKMLGEVGIFAPTHQRMDTAICETEVELGVMATDKVLELYHQDRRFGFFLIRLVSQRLVEDYGSLRDGLVAARQGSALLSGGEASPTR